MSKRLNRKALNYARGQAVKIMDDKSQDWRIANSLFLLCTEVEDLRKLLRTEKKKNRVKK